MARGIKRRRKYTWFPVSGTDAGQGINVTGREFVITTGSGPDLPIPVTAITPLTFDSPADPDVINVTDPGVLAGMVGQEYVIERIVGSIHAGVLPERAAADDPTTAQTVYLAAGIFVARADDGNPSVPIGANTGGLLSEYDPQVQDTIREPWMWRRTWMLTNPAFPAAFQTAGGAINGTNWQSQFPFSTGGYGDANSGPFIDVRSNRRVGQDDRLWLVTSARGFPASLADRGGVVIRGIVDVRILGQLRRARNSGKF